MDKNFIASVYREDCGEIKIVNSRGEDLTKTKSIHHADALAGFYVERLHTREGRVVNILTNDEFNIFVKQEGSEDWVIQGSKSETPESLLEKEAKQ